MGKVMSRLFSGIISTGHVTVIRANGRTETYGDGNGPELTVRFTSSRAERQVLFRPRLGIGEAYMSGGLVIEQGSLHDLFEIGAATLGRFGSVHRWLNRLFENWQHINFAGRSRRNVAHHYDLRPELFAAFLDSDLQYSCAYFRDPSDDLETAQAQKKDHIAAKLHLAPGQRVLDIGSGWGGLGIHLAKRGASDVTGVTLSVEQQKTATQRARAAGLAETVRFELRDYRHQHGQFDRIVSVGMFEHVGRAHYRAFFDKVAELMTDDGVCLLHTIGKVAGRQPINSWMRKYIFPGAYLPSLSELVPAIEQAGLWLTDFENLRYHYAHTLDRWNQRFQDRRAEIADMYDERFCRMWEFYLIGCQMAFIHRGLTVFQLQLTKRPDAIPMTRDYIYRNAVSDRHTGASAALADDRSAA